MALNLESQMVFSRDPEAEEIEAEYAALDKREVSCFNERDYANIVLNFFFFKSQSVWSSLQYAIHSVICIAMSMKIHLKKP